MNQILLLTTIMITLVSLMMSFYVMLTFRRIRASKTDFDMDGRIAMDPMRQQLENDVYRAQSKLSSSYVGFSTVKNIYRTKLGDVNLSMHAFDDSFFTDMGFNLDQISVELDAAFCLMPFHPNYNKVYNSIMRATRMSNFHCYRGDEQYTAGDILRRSVELILKSQIVIAVLDGRNSNVFYELGIAHSVGKPVILVTEKKSEIPFDLNSNRFIFYKSSKDLELKLEAALKAVRNNG